jgi:hypothetical protein
VDLYKIPVAKRKFRLEEEIYFIKRRCPATVLKKTHLRVCGDTSGKSIDDKCLLDNNWWKAELDYLLWERDNE